MKKKLILAILLVLVGLIIVWGANLAIHAINLYQSRQEVKSMLQGGMDSISPQYAFHLINQVDDDLAVINQNLGWLYPVFSVTGRMTAQVELAVKYLKSLTGYMLLFEEKLAPLMDAEINNGFQMTGLINEILLDPAILSQAKNYSDDINRYHTNLDISALPLRFQDDFQMIEPFVPLIVASGKIMPILPDLVGMHQTSQYLLLALNQDELRGGGGFITAMGTVQLNNLTNIEFDMSDSYQVDDFSKDYPLPPQPLQDYMLAGMWVPRDGNWSADFPSSAAMVQELYELSTGQFTQGVIAFDQQAVISFLDVMGPVNVGSEQNLTVDANNVLDYMYSSWGDQSSSEDWWANRKDFVAILGKAMLQNLIDNRDYRKLISMAEKSKVLIQSGHLMLYFNELDVQSVLSEMNLDGSIQYKSGDFLYWVDSNIGFNKVDAVLLRSLTYTVDLSDLDNPTAHLQMEYQHPINMDVPCVHEASYGNEIAYANMFQRCYWDYWRVYTAPATQLSNANVQFIPGNYLLTGNDWQGQLDLTSDLEGLGMVGGLQVVPTNSTRVIALDFILSPDILNYENGEVVYELTVQKQLGLNELPVNIIINVPQNFKLDSKIDWLSTNQTTYRFHEELNLNSNQYNITLKHID